MAFKSFAGVKHLGAQLANKAGEVVDVLGGDVGDHVQLLHRGVFGARAGHADVQVDVQRDPGFNLDIPSGAVRIVAVLGVWQVLGTEVQLLLFDENLHSAPHAFRSLFSP